MVNSVISIPWLLGGTLIVITAILSLIWTPYDLVLEERLRMRPGLPPFDWWFESPDIIRIKMYLFNITNAGNYLSGLDEKLKFEQVGPIIFREIRNYTDVVFNENSTMSYTERRFAVLDPTLNTIDLNATVTYPNFAVLLTASQYWKTNYFVKKMLNYALEKTEASTVISKTIYEILYDNSDRFLKVANTIAPFMVSLDNVGLVPLMYPGAAKRMTVFIGTKHSHQRFFLIDKINGSSHIPGRGSDCKDSVVNASNTYTYSQLTPRTRKMKVFNEQSCRSVTLFYKDEVYHQGIKGDRYILPEDAYYRTTPVDDDCYKGEPILPNGVIDMSPCWFSFPIVGSHPYFIGVDNKSQYIANSVFTSPLESSKYQSYVVLEPVTGIALNSAGMVQVNLHIRPLTGFHKMFDRFSNTVIPTFLIGLSGEDVPTYVVIFIRAILLLPTIGPILSSLLFLLGACCVWKSVTKISKRRRRLREETDSKDAKLPEAEAFL